MYLGLHAADSKSIKILPITPEDGISVIAFLFKELLDKYGEEILEVAMDLTCESCCSHTEKVDLTFI